MHRKAENEMLAAKGLEGVVVSATSISHVFGEEGRLVYRGYDINQLASKATYEEVSFLLWNGRLPKREELDALQLKMRGRRTLPPAALAALRALPHDADPMDALRTVVSAAGAALP